jgi:hypothetical protein
LIANPVNGDVSGRAAAGAGLVWQCRSMATPGGALPWPVSMLLSALASLLPATFPEGVHD